MTATQVTVTDRYCKNSTTPYSNFDNGAIDFAVEAEWEYNANSSKSAADDPQKHP